MDDLLKEHKPVEIKLSSGVKAYQLTNHGWFCNDQNVPLVKTKNSLIGIDGSREDVTLTVAFAMAMTYQSIVQIKKGFASYLSESVKDAIKEINALKDEIQALMDKDDTSEAAVETFNAKLQRHNELVNEIESAKIEMVATHRDEIYGFTKWDQYVIDTINEIYGIDINDWRPRTLDYINIDRTNIEQYKMFTTSSLSGGLSDDQVNLIGFAQNTFNEASVQQKVDLKKLLSDGIFNVEVEQGHQTSFEDAFAINMMHLRGFYNEIHDLLKTTALPVPDRVDWEQVHLAMQAVLEDDDLAKACNDVQRSMISRYLTHCMLFSDFAVNYITQGIPDGENVNVDANAFNKVLDGVNEKLAFKGDFKIVLDEKGDDIYVIFKHSDYNMFAC